MGRSSAYIEIWCEHPHCEESIEIDLCELAALGEWDERDVAAGLAAEGWTIEAGNEFCEIHSRTEVEDLVDPSDLKDDSDLVDPDLGD